jgi:hypothetical protein
MKKLLLGVIAFAMLSLDCSPAPVVTPKPPVVNPYLIGIVVQAADDGETLVGIPVQLHTTPGPLGYTTQTTGGSGIALFSVDPALVDSDVIISYPRYQTLTAHINVVNQKNYFFSLVDAMPQPPSRDEILSAHESFQGLMVTCDGYGTFPWFDPAISSLDATCRQNVYEAKHAAGDTALRIDVSWNYSGDNGYSYPVPGTDLTTNLNQLRALVLEAINAGFYVRLGLAGDGESEASCADYNDPVGHTYGRQCAQNSILPAVLDILDDTPGQPALSPYCVFITGYDSVFYSWSPQEVADFATAFRKLRPNGYLGIEFNTGHIPVGNGPSDYGPTGLMSGYDLILGEFNNWPTTGDAAWQVIARMVGPPYVRAPDQPIGDDPNPPYYLKTPSARGKYYFDCLEWAEYDWVRNRVSAAQIDAGRAYYKAMGCPLVG